MSKHTPGRCPDKAANGGTCPHHNLQCAWPKCEPQARASESKHTPVWIVAAGAVHQGRETYTRHETRPPLCDAECLYPAAEVERLQRRVAQLEAAARSAREALQAGAGQVPTYSFDRMRDDAVAAIDAALAAQKGGE